MILDTKPQLVNSDTLAIQIGHSPDAFWELFERHYESVYRYFIIRSSGNHEESVDMTARTFCVVLYRHKMFHRDSFTTWLFGIAWDVLNEQRHRVDTKPDSFKGPRAEFHRMIEAIRALSFYPREVMYLRFFAGLSAKDIGCLMDKSEITIKILELDGILRHTTYMDGIEAPMRFLPKDQFELQAIQYDDYLSDLLLGSTPRQSLPVGLIRATNRIRSLHETMTSHTKIRPIITKKIQSLLASQGRGKL